MNLEHFAALVALLMVLLLRAYVRGYRNRAEGKFDPVAAHLRAGIFFCFCYLMSWATGTLEAILSEPVFTAEQVASPWWWSWVAGLTVFILVAYWGVWARFTMRFERELDLLPQVLFGLLWGTAFGQLFLSFWHIAALLGTGWATWQTWLLCYAWLSIWQWLVMDLFWDVWVSPEHDTAWSIALKVPATHVPNVTLALTFFAIYENHLLFVASQTLALVGCSVAMRMPAPWSRADTPPARQGPSMFWGLPRAVGYQSPDPANDPYLRQAKLPR